MSCADRFEKEVLDKTNHRDELNISDTEMIARTMAICFDELIAELGLIRRELNERLDNVGVQLENLQNITVYKG